MKIRPLTEGYVVKGGRNHGELQITERPAPPGAINRPAEADDKDVIVIVGRGPIEDRSWKCKSAFEATMMMKWLADNAISCTRMSVATQEAFAKGSGRVL